jgi:hypothetical protein
MHIIPDEHPERIEVMVMFRILTRREWDKLQSWHKSCPGSTVEHLYAGLYTLTIPAGGVWEAA